MPAQSVNDATFDTEVTQAALPVLVEFGTEWCAPCKQLLPALNEIAAEMAAQIKVVQVDLDQNPSVAAELGVRGIPALFIYKNGQPIAQKSGALPKSALVDWITSTI